MDSDWLPIFYSVFFPAIFFIATLILRNHDHKRDDKRLLESTNVMLKDSKTKAKAIMKDDKLLRKDTYEIQFTTDSTLVREEDQVLCANCGKQRYLHKECNYHAEVGGPCDCSKFIPKN